MTSSMQTIKSKDGVIVLEMRDYGLPEIGRILGLPRTTIWETFQEVKGRLPHLRYGARRIRLPAPSVLLLREAFMVRSAADEKRLTDGRCRRLS